MTLRLADDAPDRADVRITPATRGATVVVIDGDFKREVPPDEGSDPPTFTVQGVPVGVFRVYVGAQGREWASVDVPVEAGGVASVTVDELPAARDPEPVEQCGGPGFPPCQQPQGQQRTEGKGVPWQYYALGGLLALGLVGWGLQGAEVEDDEDEPEDNPRRRGGRR